MLFIPHHQAMPEINCIIADKKRNEENNFSVFPASLKITTAYTAAMKTGMQEIIRINLTNYLRLATV